MLPSLISGTPMGAPQVMAGSVNQVQYPSVSKPSQLRDLPYPFKMLGFAKYILLTRPSWFPFGQIAFTPVGDDRDYEIIRQVNQRFEEYLLSKGLETIEDLEDDYWNNFFFVGFRDLTVDQATIRREPIMYISYERLLSFFQLVDLQ